VHIDIVGTALWWITSCSYGAGLIGILVGVEKMRQQVNSMLPAEQKIYYQFRINNRFADIYAIFDAHRQYFPDSNLPKVTKWALALCLLGFAGMFVALFLAPQA
jgi:hypothetical protein